MDITDFGAVSGRDCTEALNTAAASGVKRLWVPAGTFYTSGWDVPNDVAVYGAAQRDSNIKALNAGQSYVIRFGSNTELHDLNVLGAKLADTCVLSRSAPNALFGKARLTRVRAAGGVKAGFMFDQHQNAKLYDCYAHYNGIGYGFINGAANVQLFGCDSDGDFGVSSHGIFLGNIFDDPFWSTKSVFYGGGRNIRWFGGIIERGAADSQVKVLRGNLNLFGVELNGGAEATVIADGSDNGWAEVSLTKCSHSMARPNVAGIARNRGRIYVDNDGGHTSGSPGTYGYEFVSDGGFIGGVGARPISGKSHPLGSRFENASTGVSPVGGGVVGFDHEKNEFVISSPSVIAGGQLYWGAAPAQDNKRLLVVELYISAITGGNARVYTALRSSPWRRLQEKSLAPGLHKFVVPLLGDEVGVHIMPDQDGSTEIRVPFVDLSIR